MLIRFISFGLFLILLYALSLRFPLRKFSSKESSSHLKLHLFFLLLISFEVYLLTQWDLISHLSFTYKVLPNSLFSHVLCLLFLDLVSYFWHRLNHEFTPLWKLHSFHHKAKCLDPFAAYRFHPLEVFLGHHVRAFFILFIGFSPLSVFYFTALYAFFNTFQHSNLKVPKSLDEVLSLIFVTPSRHHTHHLKDERFHQSNFGTIFIFWDKIFKTYKKAPRIRENDLGI